MNRKAPTWQIDIARHLLGDLEGHREAEVRAYIESGDAETARLSAEARTALARLMDALEPNAPPETARRRLLDRVRQTHPLEGVADRGAPGPLTISAPDSPAHRRRRSPVPIPSSIAAVLALLAVFVGAIMANRSPSPAPTANLPDDAQHGAVESGRAQLDVPDGFSLAGMMQSFFDVIPLQTRTLEPTLPDDASIERPVASGRLLLDRKHRMCYVFSPMLEPAGDNEVYQLWFAGEQSEPMSVGMFDVNASGWGAVRLDLPGDDLTFARASISRRSNDVGTANGVMEELLFGRFTR